MQARKWEYEMRERVCLCQWPQVSPQAVLHECNKQFNTKELFSKSYFQQENMNKISQAVLKLRSGRQWLFLLKATFLWEQCAGNQKKQESAMKVGKGSKHFSYLSYVQETFFFLTSALLHSRGMCIFPPAEDKQSKFSSKESLQDWSTKKRKIYLITKMRENHFLQSLWISNYHFLGDNVCVNQLSTWTWNTGKAGLLESTL